MLHRFISTAFTAALLTALLLHGGCADSVKRTADAPLVVHSISIAYNNVHLVTGDFGAFLVDAGMAADAPALAARLRELGTEPASLKAVIVTHGHADHAGGARYFQQQFGVPVVAGAGDRAMLGAGRNDRLCPTDFIARRMVNEAQAGTYPATVADIAVDGPTRLSAIPGLQSLDGTIVVIPGHTPGSIAVVVGKLAFVGDLFRGGVAGAGASEHFFMCDPASNRRDIQDFFAGPARGADTFFTGHFGPASRAAVGALVDGFAKASK